jgi:small GTP-binding protein
MTIKKKICLVGAFAVGKTSLVQRYVHSLFSDKYLTTVGVKVDKKTLDLGGGTIVELIIWDLYGEDNFQTVRMSYLKGASGCFYVADGTRPNTLAVALDLQARVEATIGKVPSIVALNKCDLAGRWEIRSPAEKQVSAKGLPFFKTSAKSGEAVEMAFSTLARLMLEGV